MNDRAKAWTAYETIGISIFNFNFKKHSPKKAEELVKSGSHRWALCAANTLTLVPSDYRLCMHESFVEKKNGMFEVIQTSTSTCRGCDGSGWQSGDKAGVLCDYCNAACPLCATDPSKCQTHGF